MSRGLLNLSGDFLGIPERTEDVLEGRREGDLPKGQWMWLPWRRSIRLGDLLGKPSPYPRYLPRGSRFCFFGDACRLHRQRAALAAPANGL